MSSTRGDETTPQNTAHGTTMRDDDETVTEAEDNGDQGDPSDNEDKSLDSRILNEIMQRYENTETNTAAAAAASSPLHEGNGLQQPSQETVYASVQVIDTNAEQNGYDDAEETSARSSMRQKQWHEQYERLKEYKRVNGHLHIKSKESFQDDNGKLSRWVSKQKQSYRQLQDGKRHTLTEDRLEALQLIGFDFNSINRRSLSKRRNSAINVDMVKQNWEKNFNLLTEYKVMHRHTNVPPNYIIEGEFLGVWVTEQRKTGAWSDTIGNDEVKNRRNKLLAIGFDMSTPSQEVESNKSGSDSNSEMSNVILNTTPNENATSRKALEADTDIDNGAQANVANDDMSGESDDMMITNTTENALTTETETHDKTFGQILTRRAPDGNNDKEDDNKGDKVHAVASRILEEMDDEEVRLLEQQLLQRIDDSITRQEEKEMLAMLDESITRQEEKEMLAMLDQAISAQEEKEKMSGCYIDEIEEEDGQITNFYTPESQQIRNEQRKRICIRMNIARHHFADTSAETTAISEIVQTSIKVIWLPPSQSDDVFARYVEHFVAKYPADAALLSVELEKAHCHRDSYVVSLTCPQNMHERFYKFLSKYLKQEFCRPDGREHDGGPTSTESALVSNNSLIGDDTNQQGVGNHAVTHDGRSDYTNRDKSEKAYGDNYSLFCLSLTISSLADLGLVAVKAVREGVIFSNIVAGEITKACGVERINSSGAIISIANNDITDLESYNLALKLSLNRMVEVVLQFDTLDMADLVQVPLSLSHLDAAADMMDVDEVAPNDDSGPSGPIDDDFQYFERRMERVVAKEYKEHGLPVHYAMQKMWEKHKALLGSTCNESCQCVYSIRKLIKGIVRSWLDEHTNGEDSGPLRKGQNCPTGLLKSFISRLMPRLMNQHKQDSPEKILERLLGMWDIHCQKRVFGKTCKGDCKCVTAWQTLFKRGYVLDGETDVQLEKKRKRALQTKPVSVNAKRVELKDTVQEFKIKKRRLSSSNDDDRLLIDNIASGEPIRDALKAASSRASTSVSDGVPVPLQDKKPGKSLQDKVNDAKDKLNITLQDQRISATPAPDQRNAATLVPVQHSSATSVTLQRNPATPASVQRNPATPASVQREPVLHAQENNVPVANEREWTLLHCADTKKVQIVKESLLRSAPALNRKNVKKRNKVSFYSQHDERMYYPAAPSSEMWVKTDGTRDTDAHTQDLGSQLVEAIRAESFGKVAQLLNEGAASCINTTKLSALCVDLKDEQACMVAAHVPKTSPKYRDCEMKMKLLKIFIEAANVYVATKGLKHGIRVELQIRVIENLQIAEDGRFANSKESLRLDVYTSSSANKNVKVGQQPPKPVSSRVEYSEKSFYFDYNSSKFSDKSIDLRIVNVCSDNKEMTLGTLSMKLSDLVNLVVMNSSHWTGSYDMQPHDKILSGRFHLDVRKLAIDDKLKAKLRSDQCHKLNELISWVDKYNTSLLPTEEEFALSANVPVEEKSTLLHSAVILHELQLISKLLAIGADPYYKGTKGSAMSLAQQNRDQNDHLKKSCCSGAQLEVYRKRSRIFNDIVDKLRGGQMPNPDSVPTRQDSNALTSSAVPSITSHSHNAAPTRPILPRLDRKNWLVDAKIEYAICKYQFSPRHYSDCKYIHVHPRLGNAEIEAKWALIKEDEMSSIVENCGINKYMHIKQGASDGEQYYTTGYSTISRKSANQEVIYVEGGQKEYVSDQGISWYQTREAAFAALCKVVVVRIWAKTHNVRLDNRSSDFHRM